MLEQVSRGSHVCWNHIVIAADAIDLHGQEHGNVERLQLSRQPDGGGASQALAIENDARARAFVGIEIALVVPIESRPDQRKRQTLPVIAHRLRIDTSYTAELDRQLAHATMRIVPSLPPAEKTDHERAPRRER